MLTIPVFDFNGIFETFPALVVCRKSIGVFRQTRVLQGRPPTGEAQEIFTPRFFGRSALALAAPGG